MTKVDELTVSVNVGLSVSDETPEYKVALVEKWAQEHPERSEEDA